MPYITVNRTIAQFFYSVRARNVHHQKLGSKRSRKTNPEPARFPDSQTNEASF